MASMNRTRSSTPAAVKRSRMRPRRSLDSGRLMQKIGVSPGLTCRAALRSSGSTARQRNRGRRGAKSGQRDHLGGVGRGRRRTRSGGPGPRDAARPSASIRWTASGMLADEVLPVVTMSSATTTESPRSRAFTMDSVIRWLAWWGTRTSMSASVTPAALQAASATLGMASAAHLKTRRPCMLIDGRPQAGVGAVLGRSRARAGAPRRAGPSLPQTTGPTPSRSDRLDHERSGPVGEDEGGPPVRRVERRRSAARTPTTSTCSAVPPRTTSRARPRP